MAVNPDLEVERTSLSAAIMKSLTNFLFEGEKRHAKLKSLENQLWKIKVFNEQPLNGFDSRDDEYCFMARQLASILSLPNATEFLDPDNLVWIRCMLAAGVSALDMFMLFYFAILTQGTDEQKSYWLSRLSSGQILGTYVQTELAHGTNVPGLETTAVYDATKQEFILNTPTAEAVKFWPGALGRTANHAVVIAQLHVGNKCYGLHMFVVQIRDLATHKLLPGIETGDVGPKMGHGFNDNGYAFFKHYRIPRSAMLTKHAKVSPSGEYEQLGSPKMVYCSMLLTRTAMLGCILPNLAAILTIAVRYSCVRKQGNLEMNKRFETKLLDYQTQQDKVLPHLANAYALFAACKRLKDTVKQRYAEMEQGDFHHLAELHSLSAGLKAYTANSAVISANSCMEACGGHGLLYSSGFPSLFAAAKACNTYEGDYTVLMLQTARILAKTFQSGGVNMMSSDTSFSYLFERYPETVSLGRDISLDNLLMIFRAYAASLVKSCVQNMEHLVAVKGLSLGEAWNLNSINLVKAARAHTQAYILESFMLSCVAAECSESREVMEKLCKLHALHAILEWPHTSIVMSNTSRLLSARELHAASQAYLKLLGEIRCIAVPLVDAFDLDDRVLRSALGKYDGNVYKHIMEAARQSSFNKHEIMPCHHETLGRVVRSTIDKFPSKL